VLFSNDYRIVDNACLVDAYEERFDHERKNSWKQNNAEEREAWKKARTKGLFSLGVYHYVQRALTLFRDYRYQQPPDGKYYFELYRDNFYEFDNKACLPKVAGNFRLRSGIITDQKTKVSPAKGMFNLSFIARQSHSTFR